MFSAIVSNNYNYRKFHSYFLQVHGELYNFIDSSVHHSLFLGHISLNITYQLLVSCSIYLSLLLINPK